MFIEKTDFDSTVHSEIIDALTRSDDMIVDTAIGEAISLAKGYLTRYDVDSIFKETGTDRHPVVLMVCKDIAIYNMHSVNNAIRMPKVREDRYNRAIEWLKEVQALNINPPDLPITIIEGGVSILYNSNTKRECHF